jgi:hypothetical protein
MIGGQQDRIACIDRVSQPIKVAALIVNDSVMSRQVEVDQSKPLDERWPEISAVGRDKSVRFIDDNGHRKACFPNRFGWRDRLPLEAAPAAKKSSDAVALRRQDG